MIGHRMLGLSLLFAGDILGSKAHLDQAVALYDPRDDNQPTRPSANEWITALSQRAVANWVLGYPDAARVDAERALRHGLEVGHGPTLLSALIFAAWTYAACGSYALARERAGEAVALAREKSASLYEAMGVLMQGLICSLAGENNSAIERIDGALAAFRPSGATVLTPNALSYRAAAQARLGCYEDASRSIAEAIAVMEKTKEKWCEADILRIAGEIALSAPAPNAAKAEAYFERALEAARGRQAKSWELRAATSSARLQRDRGRRADARDLLASVYGWFTEGFDTPDLKNARALLEELAA